jgi:metal-dependent amidase/aminoacylase/carboxypeptidase family protein
MAEARMAQIMNHIAAKHGCTCRIDWDRYCVYFDGPEEKREAVTAELQKFWGCA